MCIVLPIFRPAAVRRLFLRNVAAAIVAADERKNYLARCGASRKKNGRRPTALPKAKAVGGV